MPALRLDENPFLVLGLTPAATQRQVEHEAQKLLGLLRLGAVRAQTYNTPWGSRPRSIETVRQAAQELRTPDRRLLHELLLDAATHVEYANSNPR